MRLLFVGTLPEPGGAASHFVSLTSALAAAGHRVAVVASPGCGIWRALAHNDRVTLYAATFTSRFARSAMETVRQAVRDVQPQWMVSVFEQDYWGTALVAAQLRVPLALVLHHAGLKRYSKLTLRFLAQRFVVPSQDLRAWVNTFGVSTERITVLHNPVDMRHFRADIALRAQQRRALGIGDTDVLIGFVGRIEANKGVIPYATALTQAMDRNPSLKALWVGFGRLEPEIDRIIQASPHASRHMRLPWTDDVLPWYTAMDVLALPSTGRESFGRVLVEAQACGIPVLGSAIGGIGEAMHAGITGQLIAAGDVDAWAQAIGDLATDHARRRIMGDAGRVFVQSRFDSTVIVSAFERMLTAATRAAVPMGQVSRTAS